VHEEPRPPHKLNDAIPRDVETITLKCLAKEPGRRYQTVRELVDDLERWLENKPIRARPIRLGERILKWAKRRPALAGLVSVSIAAILSLLVGGTWFTLELEAERNHALEENAKFRHTLYAAHTHLAYQAWRDAEIKRVLDLLDGEGCPPELRGWEW